MKKTLLSLLFIAGGAGSILAQSILTAATNNPVINDAFTTVNCDTASTFVQATILADTGAGITWNYSGLVLMSYDTAVEVNCSSTPYCSIVLAGTNAAQQSLTGGSYTYSILSADSVSETAFYSPTTQFLFGDPLKLMEYPFTYHSAYTDNYSALVNTTISGISVTAHQSGSVSVYCDGYGTLTLPGGITNTGVIRVRSSQIAIDSANILGLDSVATLQINTYEWYMPDYHSPLMTIVFTDQVGTGSGGEHFKTISYAMKYPLGLQNISLENSLAVFPNPATSELNIKFNAPANEKVTISLVDMLGREVANIPASAAAGEQLVTMNTNSVARGVYMLRLQSGSETTTRKVSIQ